MRKEREKEQRQEGGGGGDLLGCVFFGIEMSFLVVSRWPKSLFLVARSLFWYRDSAFCCSASRSSSSWDQPVRAFWASTSCPLEVKEDLDTEKMKESRYLKKDISIPTKRVTLKYGGVQLGAGEPCK